MSNNKLALTVNASVDVDDPEVDDLMLSTRRVQAFGGKITEEMRVGLTADMRRDLERAAEFQFCTASQLMASLVYQYLYGFNHRLQRSANREEQP